MQNELALLDFWRARKKIDIISMLSHNCGASWWSRGNIFTCPLKRARELKHSRYVPTRYSPIKVTQLLVDADSAKQTGALFLLLIPTALRLPNGAIRYLRRFLPHCTRTYISHPPPSAFRYDRVTTILLLRHLPRPQGCNHRCASVLWKYRDTPASIILSFYSPVLSNVSIHSISNVKRSILSLRFSLCDISDH